MPELTQDERDLLRTGLHEWGGAAHLTDALAVAMGFRSTADFFTESKRLDALLAGEAPLSSRDWRRALLATEIVFVSDVVGSGVEWTTTAGLDDDETLRLLRSLQRKLIAH
jgi:hypothetical protein